MAEAHDARTICCTQCGKTERSSRGPVPKRTVCRSCSCRASPVRRAEWTGVIRPAKPCMGCGCDLPSWRHRRCGPCNATYYRAYHKDRWHQAARWERPESACDGCGAKYVPHVPSQRYCSKPCRAKADSRRVSEARPLYRYARWKRIRAEQLVREPSCRFCALAGIQTPASVCDHVEPHRGSVDLFWRGPFQSLCVECHNRTKQSIERRAA